MTTATKGRVTTFEFKLGGMRKPDRFIVYPRSTSVDRILVQGARTIASIEGDGVGMLNWKGSRSKHFVDLNPAMGAERVEYPPEFLALVVEHMPEAGDIIGGNASTGIIRVA